LLPGDGTTFKFKSGTYTVEIFATLVGETRPLKLRSIDVEVTDSEATQLGDRRCGLYFEWSPETATYTSHIDDARIREELPPFLILAPPALAPPSIEGDTNEDSPPKALGK